MHDTAHAQAVEASTDPMPKVQISRYAFDRIEGLRTRVAETTITLDRAAREHKDAKSAHDTAQQNLSAAVRDMIDEVNGVSKLPLFDNQNDAIAKAEADPVAQKLLARMLEHGISHLNVLTVAGYTEDQRNELAAYLDALDARKQAESLAANMPEQITDQTTATVDIPPLPDLPAFLIEQAEPPMTEDQADAFSCQLQEEGIEIAPRVLIRMNLAQRQETAKWLNDVRNIKAEKGDALTMDDLPPAPSFIVNPAELSPVEDAAASEASADEPARELTTELDEPVKAPRAKRRSSATFKNSPRVVKGKKAKARQ